MARVREIGGEDEREDKKGRQFCINDNMDVLIEILKRLDDKSLGVAACVCRLWCALTRNDALWEHLCFRQLSPPPEGVRTVVVALGGYRRLYTVCVKPVLSRLGKMTPAAGEIERRLWTRHEVELSLSLFCVDYYERLFLCGGGGGGRLGGDAAAAAAPPPSSLMFLCKAVNV
ncbi:F-box protein SNE-like [Salvia miltiorrhiza]|uniref:F-box protein SNE-like n=1 Tax=Salvia miltiorrhiza TaxID=226208 RepID=UPI0025ACD1F3|nr:F-box protein SNE-like [Salvia miltiorrhiza]